MLQYVRKYFLLYYAVAFIPALIYLASMFFSSGVQGLMSAWTWITTVLIVVACTIISSRVMNRAAGTEVKQLMRIFVENCDPYNFIEKGSDIAARIKTPFNEWGSLFMSAYSLAYIDIGEATRAQEIVDNMRISAQASRKPLEVAHICLNMHAPIKLLYGPELALQCLYEAETDLGIGLGEGSYQEVKTYIDQERSFDIAENLVDNDEIIRLYKPIVSNEKLFTRTRVLAAMRIADAYQRLDNDEHEKKFLEFVIEHGNKLSAVSKAQARIGELT